MKFTKKAFKEWVNGLPEEATFRYASKYACVFATFIETFDSEFKSCSGHGYFTVYDKMVAFPLWAGTVSLFLAEIEGQITKKHLLEIIKDL